MLEGSSGSWRLAGADEGVLDLPNAYLGYLQDRNYSPRTIRTYGYGLLAFGRSRLDVTLQHADLIRRHRLGVPQLLPTRESHRPPKPECS